MNPINGIESPPYFNAPYDFPDWYMNPINGIESVVFLVIFFVLPIMGESNKWN